MDIPGFLLSHGHLSINFSNFHKESSINVHGVGQKMHNIQAADIKKFKDVEEGCAEIRFELQQISNQNVVASCLLENIRRILPLAIYEC